jgi:hypothetical protein
MLESTSCVTFDQGLVFYAHNSPATNAAIAAMLERIAVDLDLEPMLYQVRLLKLSAGIEKIFVVFKGLKV